MGVTLRVPPPLLCLACRSARARLRSAAVARRCSGARRAVCGGCEPRAVFGVGAAGGRLTSFYRSAAGGVNFLAPDRFPAGVVPRCGPWGGGEGDLPASAGFLSGGGFCLVRHWRCSPRFSEGVAGGVNFLPKEGKAFRLPAGFCGASAGMGTRGGVVRLPSGWSRGSREGGRGGPPSGWARATRRLGCWTPRRAEAVRGMDCQEHFFLRATSHRLGCRTPRGTEATCGQGCQVGSRGAVGYLGCRTPRGAEIANGTRCICSLLWFLFLRGG